MDAQQKAIANPLRGLTLRGLSNVDTNIDKSIDTRHSDTYNQKVADIKNSGKNKRQIKQELESLQFKDGGEFIKMKLTDDEIKKYRDGGYVVEELPKAEYGFNYRKKEKQLKSSSIDKDKTKFSEYV